MKNIVLIILGVSILSTSCKKEKVLEYSNDIELEQKMTNQINGKWELTELIGGPYVRSLFDYEKVINFSIDKNIHEKNKGWFSSTDGNINVYSSYFGWKFDSQVNKLVVYFNFNLDQHYTVIKVNENELVLKGVRLSSSPEGNHCPNSKYRIHTMKYKKVNK